MRAPLSNLLKSLGFVECEACDGKGVAEDPMGLYVEPPGDCPACEGAGVVRRSGSEHSAILHDDFRPEVR